MTAIAVEQSTRTTRVSPRRVPMTRIVGVELRKMFDTRSGFWMLASILATAAIASVAVIAFAPDKSISYDTLAASFGVPMTIILPMIAILSVTSEWSQRSGLTTFTLVPHRSRVIAAKLVAAVMVAVVSIPLALGVGAVANLVASALNGTDVVWDISVVQSLDIILANVMGLLVGFTLGVLIRNSAGAVVGYFVYSFVLPTLAGLLAANQHWFHRLQPWVDFNFAQGQLYNGQLSGEQWAHLGTAAALWLVLPLLIGLRLVMRAEVK